MYKSLTLLVVLIAVFCITCNKHNPNAPGKTPRVKFDLTFAEDGSSDLTTPVCDTRLSRPAALQLHKGTAALTGIDKTRIVFYTIDVDYTVVRKNYTERMEELEHYLDHMTGDRTDFDGYWMRQDRGELDIVAPAAYRVEKTAELEIKNGVAHGEFELTEGLKACRLGLWEKGRLVYIGRASALDGTGFFNVEGGETHRITMSLYPVNVNTNSAPVAVFTASPNSGTTTTFFSFDASGCYDAQDPASSLQVRWDWEDDGEWDTDYTTQKTATHQFTTAGSKMVILEVMDSGYYTDETTREITVTAAGGETGTMTDLEGNIYRTIKIGDQWWMAENLKVTRYRNGDEIPYVYEIGSWESLRTGACCFYDNNDANIESYGYLYNWYAVIDNRNIAPSGWHVPSDEEWLTLVNYLGGVAVAGGKLKENGTVHWTSPNTGANNASGFSALPGGYRRGFGDFVYINLSAYFWTTSASGSVDAFGWYLNNTDSQANRVNGNPAGGFSIRCVRDN